MNSNLDRDRTAFEAASWLVREITGLFRDPVIIDRVVELASHRKFLIGWIAREVENAQDLRNAIFTELEGGVPLSWS